MNGLVIGKRIVFGQVVLSIATATGFVWDWLNPENPIPAGLVGAIAQAITGIGQVYIVNRFGITNVQPSQK